MKAALLIATFTILVIVLTSVDFSFEWSSPIESEGEVIQWHESVGLRNGFFGMFSNELGQDKKSDFYLHAPEMTFLPFIWSGGPEGGVCAISVWVVLIVLILAWLLIMRFRRTDTQRINQDE